MKPVMDISVPPLYVHHGLFREKRVAKFSMSFRITWHMGDAVPTQGTPVSLGDRGCVGLCVSC